MTSLHRHDDHTNLNPIAWMCKQQNIQTSYSITLVQRSMVLDETLLRTLENKLKAIGGKRQGERKEQRKDTQKTHAKTGKPRGQQNKTCF